MLKWREFALRPGDRVLDIGCGLRPHPLATHLADRDLWQRHNGRWHAVPAAGRAFIRCRLEALPFPDQSFDFAVCSHVLEHVRDPARCCAELARVAPRGYIETPASWLEPIFSAPDHRWLVDLEAGTLVFREKLPAEHGDPLGLRYELPVWLEEPFFRLYWELDSVRSIRTVRLLWGRRIPLLVIRAGRRGPRRAARTLRPTG